MRLTCHFRAETIIESGIDQVYAFHENPHHIREISPGWQRVEDVRADHVAKVDGSFHIKIRLFGVLPLQWQGVWRAADRPVILVDEMIRGPFAYWRHEHRFKAIGTSQTLMTDQVEYQFFGGILGKLFGETLGRLQFHLMFADRQARTRRRLREQK